MPCGNVTPCRDILDLRTPVRTIFASVFIYLFIIHGVPEMVGEGDLGEPGVCLGHGLGVFFGMLPQDPSTNSSLL